MSEIEKKALALINEVERDFGDNSPTIRIIREDLMDEALCRAIEQHEAYKQEVSDAVKSYLSGSRSSCILDRFIIAKPDPLVEAMVECGFGDSSNAADDIREALAKRGLKIVETEQ